jgi:hypothetical protein
VGKILAAGVFSRKDAQLKQAIFLRFCVNFAPLREKDPFRFYLARSIMRTRFGSVFPSAHTTKSGERTQGLCLKTRFLELLSQLPAY